MGDLAQFNFFSGHFDAQSIEWLPIAEKRVVTILREPASRLLSLYTYLRALKPEAATAQKRNMQLSTLARNLEPEEFFSDERVRSNPSIDNAMVRATAFALPSRSWEAHSKRLVDLTRAGPSVEDCLRVATGRLEGMTAFGLVEEMTKTVPYIFESLGLATPTDIAHENVTSTIHKSNGGFVRAKPVKPSKDLTSLLDSLTYADQEMYEYARQILSQRGVLT